MASAVGEASSSSPSSPATPRSWTYHVFLSFRGEDTRKGFTGHLCAALERKGIVTYRDDKNLERGEVIKDELLKAIEESMFAIIVLSPNYASSAWCLDELQKIVECSKNHGLSIVPIFYGVEPSDVRHQKGSVEEALRKHEQRFKEDSEKVKGWRDALTQVANYSGWDSKYQHEATLVESIARHVHTKLTPKLPACTENLVGIAPRVKELTRLIDIRLNDVRFIGIWGMGGIGKTTITRAVYEAIKGEFQVSCFLADVRQTCETYGLVQMQKDLVSHSHMNKSTSTIKNVYDGKRTIQSSLCKKKVLLVLDDISHIRQLESLAGKQDWFGLGSRVLITTRDMHLLKIHEMYDIYEMGCLVQNEALRLFCLKAFKRDQPKKGYLEMSHEVVKYTGGLPLALKVLGSYLYGRTIDVWHSAVKKIKNVPHSEILDTLKISYEGLDSMEKHIFLDIACLFKGMNKDEVIDILEKCGYNPQIEIDVLIEKSLITIDQGTSNLDMHDLLQEMGKNIVIEESPNDPSKRSRLWSKEDISLALTQNKETEAIQSIILRYFDYEVCRRDKTLLNISQLKFLNLDGVEVSIHLKLPSSLKVLHLGYCHLETLPLADQQYELVEIKLLHCKIVQVWHGEKFLKKLKYLDLSRSSLEQTPDFSGVPNLETLALKDCICLTNIHPSLIHHKSLVVLNLSGCERLKTLPGKLEMSSLKELFLCDCRSLIEPPEFGECMKYLSKLSLDGTAIRELPTSLGCLVGLSDLDLSRCKELTCLPDSIHGLKTLRNLIVSWCPNLHRLPYSLSSLPLLSGLYFHGCFLSESFPHDFYGFTSLTDLDLSLSDFVRLPIKIHKLAKLRRLGLNGCLELKFIPELPSSIRQLEACNCDSLNEFEFNALSKACCIFASICRDRGEALRMVLPGTEIPSWFVHRQEGNGVLIPLPHNCPLNERLGIALCFVLQPTISWRGRFDTIHLAGNNGDRIIISNSILPVYLLSCHLCILCMTNDCLSDEIHHFFRIVLSFKGNVVNYNFKILSSAARWLRIEDIHGLSKCVTERPKQKG